MKVGDLVQNIMTVRNNPVVNKNKGWLPIKPGYTGVVTAVRVDALNNPPLTGYCDVVLSVEGETVRCGNYGQGHFEVIS